MHLNCSHHGNANECNNFRRWTCDYNILSTRHTCTLIVAYTYECTKKNIINYNLFASI